MVDVESNDSDIAVQKRFEDGKFEPRVYQSLARNLVCIVRIWKIQTTRSNAQCSLITTIVKKDRSKT